MRKRATTSTPQGWLDFAGIGMFATPPNRWNRFWAWFLFGWRWHNAKEAK